jgi:hypothetical protein
MAKSEDMPKLVSSDRFKVVALETKLDDIEIDHRANDEEKKHELVVRQAIGNMEQSLLPAGPAC